MASITDYGYGNGSDGAVIVSSSKNCSTNFINGGRSYVDMISYNVSDLTLNTATLTENANGISTGDKVLLINLQGKSGNYDQVGNWEILEVQAVGGTIVTFTDNKVNYYGSTNGDDDNIGTSTSSQRVVLQRIPQYTDLTINSGQTLSVDGWNGLKNGIICAFVDNDLTVAGDIVATGAGFRGTQTGYGARRAGENIVLKPTANDSSETGNQPGGGAGAVHYGAGAGGGYGTAGANSWCDNSHTLYGGSTYGQADLDAIFFGSSGGDGYSTSNGSYGGGIIMLFSRYVSIAGTVSCNGTDGDSGTQGGPGGGAGGSLLLWTASIDNSTINAYGGQGAAGWGSNPGSDGGVGRIAIYSGSIGSVTSTPTAYEEITTTYKVFGILSDDAHVVVYDASNDDLLVAEDKTSGAYELTGININTEVNVIAIRTDGKLLGYGKVTPVIDI